MTNRTHPELEFWSVPLADVQAALLGTAAGLSSADAAVRASTYGPNLLRPRAERAVIWQFLTRFGNPLVVLLLVAATISAFTGDVTSFAIITGVVVMSVTLDFLQEYRAGRAAEQLQHSVALRVRVRRDGQDTELPAAELVPGDIVTLSPGGLVPADGRVLAARDCYVNQSLLTGESYPVEKYAGEETEPGVLFTASTHALLMGTSLMSGTATMLVCRTGARTSLGEIGESLLAKRPATSFELGIQAFGMLILRLAMLMVPFVLLVNAFFHRPWLESFLFAIALAVGLTPELLPMVVSVTLAKGALRLSRERVIVKRLSAVMDLGSMDILCTDKTGTLTEARIRLEQHLDPQGRDSARALWLGYLNSALETGLRNPLDEAILRHTEVDVSGWRKIDEVPFDFERRRVSILADDGQVRLLVLKGALEDVLAHCTRYEAGGPHAVLALDPAMRAQISHHFERLGREGFRVLGIAWRRTPPEQAHAGLADESDLVFAGFLAFEDPPKPSAAAAVRALTASGVRVVVITGDNEWVTQHVCDQLGVPTAGLLTGADLREISDPALAVRVASVSLFCRVSPAQKERILRALRSRGHVVGYLGDGINDAPALHTADVGISVADAVDVAKAAADLILLDHDLEVVQRGVLEGRRTFGNIMKYVKMGTSSNFGNMFSMAGATLLLPFLPMLPVQILVNNFLYDLSELPIPLDRVDAETLACPRRWDLQAIRRFMVAIGLVSSLFDFALFFIMRHVFHAGEALFHTGWFVESLATQVLVIFVIRTRGNPLRSMPSAILTTTSMAVVAVATALPFTPLGARLGLVPLPAAFFGILALMVAAYLGMVEAVKHWYYRRFEPA